MKSDLNFFIYKNGKWYEIPTKEGVALTIRKLCNNPIALRFNIEGNFCYFTGDENVWIILKCKGKKVRNIAELFETQRQQLVEMGFRSDSSIFNWSLDRVFSLRTIFKVFPGAGEVQSPMKIAQ